MKHRFTIELPQGEVQEAVDDMISRYGGSVEPHDYLERLCERPDGTMLAETISAFSHLVVVDRTSERHLENMLDWAVRNHPLLNGLSQTAIDGFEASIQRGISATIDGAPQYWLPDFRNAIELPHSVEPQKETA